MSFSDGVFAVIVTIMVLEFKAPNQPSFSALWPLWPTAISYAVSYLFVAIIWIKQHHLMRFVGPPTLGLICVNFIHLFYGRAPAVRDCMGCAHPARILPCRLLRRAVCMRRYRLRMRRRSGSAYNNLLGSGFGTRNRPIAPGESGPCC
jgi:hypothetical protein